MSHTPIISMGQQVLFSLQRCFAFWSSQLMNIEHGINIAFAELVRFYQTTVVHQTSQ